MTDRIHCPECTHETEFVQFADGSEATTETDQDEVGSGVLELRYCSECKIGLENILSIDSQTVVQ